jgi:hypothetical protein
MHAAVVEAQKAASVASETLKRLGDLSYYIYIYIYIYICMYTYTYTYIHTYREKAAVVEAQKAASVASETLSRLEDLQKRLSQTLVA